jgi:drug/metabolite transporter (DMT)-like permease
MAPVDPLIPQIAGAGVAFALLSLLFAGLNDVAFKRYAVRDRSRGMLVLGVGVVWTTLQLGVVLWRGDGIALDRVTLAFGIAAGLLLVLSNILLLESFGRVDLSLGSTVYRLNTLAVVVLAYLFLGERVTALKGAGVGVGVLAVLLLARTGGGGPHRVGDGRFLLAVITAALLRAAYGVVTRQAMLSHVSPAPLLLCVSTSWIVGGAAYALAREGRLRLTGEKALYSLVSGTLVFLIVTTLLLAVERGEASVVIPIANMSFVVALLVSLGTGMERPTGRKLLSIGLAVAAVILLSRS